LAAPDERAREAKPRSLPSEWLRAGRFAKYRTVDLEDLGAAVGLFADDVTGVWRSAREDVVAAARAAARREKTSEAFTAFMLGATSIALDRLGFEWVSTSAPLYGRAAEIGRRSAGLYAGSLQDPEVFGQQAQVYATKESGFLLQPGGLLSDVRTRISAAVSAFSAEIWGRGERASTEIPDTGVGTEEWWGAVLADAVAGAFDVNEHRIDAYAGRLVEVATTAFLYGLEASGTVAEGTAAEPKPGARATAEWWCEWVQTADDRTCPTCSLEGGRGFVPLSSLVVRPGGGTECGGRCRCVLVTWTKDEVSSGEAIRLGPLD
jgi:hypothetical protein